AGGLTRLLLALALVVGGQGLAGPALSSLISKAAEARSQGRVLGVSQSLSSGARVLGPGGGGSLDGLAGPGAPCFVARACAGVAVGIAVPFARRAFGSAPAEYEASLHSS